MQNDFDNDFFSQSRKMSSVVGKVADRHSSFMGNVLIVGAVQTALALLTVGCLIAGFVTGNGGVFIASAVFAGIFCIILIAAAVAARRTVSKTMGDFGSLFDKD